MVLTRQITLAHNGGAFRSAIVFPLRSPSLGEGVFFFFRLAMSMPCVPPCLSPGSWTGATTAVNAANRLTPSEIVSNICNAHWEWAENPFTCFASDSFLLGCLRWMPCALCLVPCALLLQPGMGVDDGLNGSFYNTLPV